MLGIYVRLSIEDDESNSVENQIAEGKEYATKNGFKNNFKIYQEKKGLKGSLDLDKRPALQNLINDITSGVITIVFARTQSRISRDMLILQKFFKSIVEKNVKMYIGGMGLLDMQDPQTKLMVNVIGAFDEFTPNKQSTQTKKALLLRVKEGKASGGVLPYGYKRDIEGKPIIDKEEEVVVKRIFNEYIKGKGIYTITEDLNDDGIPTKTVKQLREGNKGYNLIRNRFFNDELISSDRTKGVWLKQTIHGILKNKWYIGIRTFNKVEYKNVPSIIDKLTFNRAQQILQTNKEKSGKLTPHHYLLKGLIVCSHCKRNYNGRRLYNTFTNPTQKRKYKSNYYSCSSKRNKHLTCESSSISILHLESFIIKHLFVNNDLINKLKEVNAKDDSLIKLNNELKSVQSLYEDKIKEADTISNRLIKGGLTTRREGILTKNLNDLDSYIEGLETKINNLEIKIQNKRNSKPIKDLKQIKKAHNKNWKFQEYKKAINGIIDKIEIHTFKEDKTKNYDILIKYKGFDYVDLFEVKRPYKNWNWLSQLHTKPSREHMLLDFEDYVGLIEDNEEGIKYPIKKGKSLPEDKNVINQIINYKDVVDDIDKLTELHSYIESGINFNEDIEETVITLNENELFDFD